MRPGTQIASPPAAGASGALDVQTLTSFDEVPAIAAEWDDLVARIGGSLYMTPDWCGVWWRHYGTGRQLRVFAIRDRGELVGVLPFAIDRLVVPFGRARVARLVGSDFTLVVADPLVAPQVAAEAFAAVVRRLVERDGIDMIHIGPLSGESPQLGGLRAGMEDVADVVEVIRDCEIDRHTVFDFPDGFEAYLQGLSKNQRGNYRRVVRKLERSFAAEVEVVRDPAVLADEYEAFVEMHQAQWRAVGKQGHFGDWPGSQSFTRELVEVLGRADRVRLLRLTADGQAVAYYLCFALNEVYYWRLPARRTGEEWDPFALGRVGLLKTMEAAAAEGATSIEAGTGRYAYKESLNARSLPLYSVVLCGRTRGARRRTRATLGLGDVLNLAYYKVWFKRLSPRIGIYRRPLWRSWIRRQF